jgi:hypothetical protein
LSFDEDILTLFHLATVLASISKIWAIFSQSSGHPDLEHFVLGTFSVLPSID